MTFFFLLIDHLGIISVIISAINPLMWTTLGGYKSANVDHFGNHKSSNVDHLVAAISPLMWTELISKDENLKTTIERFKSEASNLKFKD